MDLTRMKLLTRDAFREGVFARDGKRCVVCSDDGQDAHHILERRLFDDGGYYLDNGATVCEGHHMEAEQTVISCEFLREAAGIERLVIPDHLYADQVYDKWGNPIMPNGRRLRGELFGDESVQKVLAGQLHLFDAWVKFPRTYHLPWSPGLGKGDRVLTTDDMRLFLGQEVVVTEKMDGENTTMYRDHIHARSLDSAGGPERDWVKRIWGEVGWQIPEGWRVCGENLFEKHTIGYDALASYFMVFSIWTDTNTALSWDDTVEWAALLGLQTVPVLWRGTYDRGPIEALYTTRSEDHEGYVVRRAGPIPYRQYRRAVGKYVRAGHINEERHVQSRRILVRNGLKGA